MGYYMRGDYYHRGDIFSAIGGVLGTVGKVATGFVTGGPVGGALALGSALQSKPKPAAGGISIPTFKGLNPFGGKPLRFGGKKGPRPKKGEEGWRPRRMHVTNPKALRRAIRRAQGFEKLAMKVLSFTRPHGRPKGHPHFKRRAAR